MPVCRFIPTIRHASALLTPRACSSAYSCRCALQRRRARFSRLMLNLRLAALAAFLLLPALVVGLARRYECRHAWAATSWWGLMGYVAAAGLGWIALNLWVLR